MSTTRVKSGGCGTPRRYGISLAVAACLISGSADAAGTVDKRAANNAAAPAAKFIRIAQAKPKLVAKPEVVGKPGSSIAMPVSISSQSPIDPTSHVIVDGTPDWMSLSAGESVGDGVWLMRASQLKDVKIKLSPDAKGERKMGVLLVDQNGKITGETQFLFKVVTAAAEQKQKKRTTWQSLVEGDAKPAVTVAAVPKPAPRKIAASGVKNPGATGRKKKKFKKLSRAESVAYAKHLVQECTTCHSLFGSDDGIPVMVGLKVDRFIDTIDLYKRGKRDNLVMINVSRSLDDQQVKVLAEYLGGIKPAARVTEKRQRTRVASRRTTASPAASSPAASSPVRSKTRAATRARSASGNRHTKRKITEAKLKRAVRWVSKGQGLLTTGRIAQARLWLRRAADYGVAEAAMLLGSSFDPNFMQTYAGYGLTANKAQARDWYVYARQLGSQVAAQRLAALPAG